mmetsp:Transcript_39871/g.88634  ORF Transcript_39871/g.88634 Transcript_39871/m.88634 type:complete len:110 (+) Transcript_39871:224-553(+)
MLRARVRGESRRASCMRAWREPAHGMHVRVERDGMHACGEWGGQEDDKIGKGPILAALLKRLARNTVFSPGTSYLLALGNRNVDMTKNRWTEGSAVYSMQACASLSQQE